LEAGRLERGGINPHSDHDGTSRSVVLWLRRRQLEY
jgi:hypothetical protein